MVNKIKQENESVRLVHDKHVSIITRKFFDSIYFQEYVYYYFVGAK